METKKSGSGDRSQGTKCSARTSWRIEGRDDVQQKQLEGNDNIYKDEEEQKNSNRMEQGEDEDRRGSNLKISNEVVDRQNSLVDKKGVKKNCELEECLTSTCIGSKGML